MRISRMSNVLICDLKMQLKKIATGQQNTAKHVEFYETQQKEHPR